MAARDKPLLWPYYVGVFFVFAFLVAAIVAFRVSMNNLENSVGAKVEQAPAPLIVPKVPSEITIKNGNTWLYCSSKTDVDYSIFELIPSGGKPPYEIVIENSLFQVQSTLSIEAENIPFTVQVYGGEKIFVKIWSFGHTTPYWEGEIEVPAQNKYCKNAPTSTPTSVKTLTATYTKTFTATPTATDTPSFQTATPTRTKGSGSHPLPTDTPTSTPTLGNPTPTNTPTPTQGNPTSINTSTPTKVVLPTPTPTDEPRRTSTPTKPPPAYTSTPTHPPAPTPTNTVIVIPRLKDCEDGIDNDGDGLTDYPDDPQCSDKKDNHEDK